MKVLLAAVNAKYIQTSLSVRALYHYAYDERVTMREYTINESLNTVCGDIISLHCDAVLFSCYIWNIDFILAAADIIKKAAPNTHIIFGGPEVSFDAVDYMKKYPFIDAIMRGEGEKTFLEWLNSDSDNILSMTYRDGENIVENPLRSPIENLDILPFPYTEEDIEKNKNKLIYYESSRGCPFSCSYCMSSTSKGVRFKSLEKTEHELMFFIRHKVPIVKFVDRTFNADKKRTYELMKFLIDNADKTTFHFEIAADLINDDILGLLKTAPPNLFQLEIGVQSTNERTINAIDRKTDFERIKKTVAAIKKIGGIHMHLDLIAGLPYEDINSFKQSFDDVFSLEPDVLQLGFLKLLRGTKIRVNEEKYGYKYTKKPPYEVICNDFMSYEDILFLKGFEDIFEKYYNSKIFRNSMRYLLKKYQSPFKLFEDIYTYFKKNELFDVSLSRNTLYEQLALIYSEPLFLDILKLDYFENNQNPSTPKWANKPFDKSLLSYRFEVLNEDFIEKNLPKYQGMSSKEIIKHIQLERFDYDVLGTLEKKECILMFDKKSGLAVKLSQGATT